jgi:hypothetical protein
MNHVWSYDFVETRLEKGRNVRVLNVIDEFTKEPIAMKNYLQTTEEHFARAVNLTQNPAQQSSESVRSTPQDKECKIADSLVSSLLLTRLCENLLICSIVRT